MKIRKLFTLFFVSMLFLSVSMGTVLAGNDTDGKKLTIIDSGGNVKDNTAVDTGKIPEIGNIGTPSTTEDITEGLGIFADMGKFILEYAVHIAIFIMVLAVVILSLRASWARSNNKVDDAVDTQKNQKGLIIDACLAMMGLLVIFYIFAPFVKSFIPS